ncbi:hypothetical protein RRG08_006478 [Elysia crispata]|uniref:Uncharacterized protein n=1 Tax=Elysia crispata TaxID=231223 RepID=A0AAE1CVY2_9GAST|nr:hypothetical protein RRG08_006478 [Elysia crispata]
MTVQDLISVDETIETSQETFVADIASSIQQSTEPEEEIANEKDIAIPPIISKTALQAMKQVRTFVMQQSDSGKTTKALQLALSLEKCLQDMSKLATKQSTNDAFSDMHPTGSDFNFTVSSNSKLSAKSPFQDSFLMSQWQS